MEPVAPPTSIAQHADLIAEIEIRMLKFTGQPINTDAPPDTAAPHEGTLARIQGKRLVDNPYRAVDTETANLWEDWKAAWEIEHYRLLKDPLRSVLRHSGRSGDHGQFRVSYRGSAEKARNHYDKLATALRQGAVCLHDPFGTTAATTSAPRLRTRW
jgi:hypothetical protein